MTTCIILLKEIITTCDKIRQWFFSKYIDIWIRIHGTTNRHEWCCSIGCKNSLNRHAKFPAFYTPLFIYRKCCSFKSSLCSSYRKELFLYLKYLYSKNGDKQLCPYTNTEQLFRTGLRKKQDYLFASHTNNDENYLVCPNYFFSSENTTSLRQDPKETYLEASYNLRFICSFVRGGCDLLNNENFYRTLRTIWRMRGKLFSVLIWVKLFF